MNEIVLLVLIVVGFAIAVMIFFDLDQKLTKKVENKSGQLIVIEGIEGSGKNKLIEMMKDNMPTTWAYTKEPYFITESNTTDWTKENIHADRELHVEKKILPLLQQNRVLVTNRYWFSGCVYDGWQIDAYANMWPEPDLVIWLDNDPTEEVAQSARVTVEVLQEMRKGYETVFQKLEEKHHHIPIVKIHTANLPEEALLEQVLAEIKKVVKFNEQEIHESEGVLGDAKLQLGGA